jgi:hypothetical protein
MHKPAQLPLRLSPPPNPVVLPAAVVEQVLQELAELLLQVQTAEGATAVSAEKGREVVDERR